MPASKDGSFASLFESAPKQGFAKRHRVGDVLDLEVVSATPETVLVALDGKQEAFIDPVELTDSDGKLTVSVGSRVAVRVVAIDRATGETQLSSVSRDPVMSVATPAAESPVAPGASVVVGMRVKGNVAGVERYGVFLEFTLPGAARPERGLIPVAELGVPRGADLRKAFPLGKELEVAVVAVDERGRVRLSVIALRDAEERRAFETYVAAEKSDDEPDGAKRSNFGTFADLTKKKKKQ
jgi:small subunit ribosomal protein S1